MSFFRLIYWSAIIGGWSAFVGWLIAEIILHRWIDNAAVAIAMATLIAIPIGGGICSASGLTNFRFGDLLKRLALGLGGGLLGGLLGSLFGSCIFSVFNFIPALAFIGRVFGFTLIGVGIGAGIGISEGIVDRSFKKLRNGLIGGVLGGFLGGLLFGIVGHLAGSITGRAISFVLLGLCIGLFIGLAQVILKEAWLTVEAGFRPGRQLILGQDLITMGTSEKSSLIFIAFGAKGVEPTHLKIIKQKDGGFLLEDNQSRTGTLLNGQAIAGPAPLKDGDAIQLGVNVVRFNERIKSGSAATKLPPAVVKETPKAAPAAPVIAVQPPPVKAAPMPTPVVQPAPAKPAPTAPIAKAPTPIAAKPPTPPAPKSAAPIQSQEGQCPICGKKVMGLPGQRRCNKCFTTF